MGPMLVWISGGSNVTVCGRYEVGPTLTWISGGSNLSSPHIILPPNNELFLKTRSPVGYLCVQKCRTRAIPLNDVVVHLLARKDVAQELFART